MTRRRSAARSCSARRAEPVRRAARTSPSRSRRSSRSSIPHARARRPLRGAAGSRGRHRARAAPRGELIASEVEIRTGRCETFAEAWPRDRRASRQLRRSPSRSASRSARPARIRGARGRSSGSSTRRTTGATTSCCATSSGATTRSASTSMSASAGPIARSGLQRPADLSARAARPLGELAVRRGRLHVPALGAHADLHAPLPALRRAGPLRRAGTTSRLRPVPLRDGLDHGAHADLVERATSPRLPDGRDPHLRRAAGARRGAARSSRSSTR